jgi:endogenous inhibitor of DNA gyrase (YacG/DUF329 family)
MTARLCSAEGCERKHLAKGLCSTHYNQQAKAAGKNYYPTVEVSCTMCGEPVAKRTDSRRPVRFCSYTCRDDHRAWQAVQAIRALPAPAPVYFGECLVCGIRWVSQRKLGATCSVECWLVLEEATRPPVPIPEPRPCAWCGDAYLSPQPHQAYCSRYCAKKSSRTRRRAREHHAVGQWSWSDFMRIAQRRLSSVQRRQARPPATRVGRRPPSPRAPSATYWLG